MTADAPAAETPWRGTRQVVVLRPGWTDRHVTVTVSRSVGQNVQITVAFGPVNGPVTEAADEIRSWWHDAPQRLAALAP